MQEVGIKESLSYLLSKAVVRTYTTFAYPGLAAAHRVRYNYLWREIEQGYCEAEALRFVSSRVQKGQTVFDVGAWIGSYTILFSKLVSNTGRVVAFEPDPRVFDVLCENLMMNAALNVTTRKMAVSDRSGRAILAAGRLGWSGASIVGYKRSNNLQTAFVETITLDEFCDRENMSPDWIKIDVEGAEGLVADGMSRIVGTCHPKILLGFHGDMMSRADRTKAWSSITRLSNRVVFIQGDDERLNNGDELASEVPSCRLIAFLQY